MKGVCREIKIRSFSSFLKKFTAGKKSYVEVESFAEHLHPLLNLATFTKDDHHTCLINIYMTYKNVYRLSHNSSGILDYILQNILTHLVPCGLMGSSVKSCQV